MSIESTNLSDDSFCRLLPMNVFSKRRQMTLNLRFESANNFDTVQQVTRQFIYRLLEDDERIPCTSARG
jgi:hypothetical protein